MDNNTPKWKSATTGELIPAVVVELKTLPDFICTEDQWEEEGPLDAWCKKYGVRKSEIRKEHHLLLNPQQFPTHEWNG